MIFRQFIHWFLILVIFTIPLIGATNTPTTMVVQANVAIGGISNYSGALDIDVGFYEYDIDDPPVWVESFQNVNVINGAFKR